MAVSRRAATAAATAATAARKARSAAAAAAPGFAVSSAFPGTSSASASASTPPGSEPVAQRSIFVHVRPAPVSLSERRSILRVLERYGKTEMFKKMAANDSFIAITSTAAMATALIRRSPMQYEFLGETLQAARPWGRPRVAALVHPVETAAGGARDGGTGADATGATDADANRADAATTAAARAASPVAHKSFVLSVFPSVDYHHRTMVRNNPLHGPWPRESDGRGSSGSGSGGSLSTEGSASYKTTFVYNALRAVVPTSAASEALCDWRDPDSFISRAVVATATPSQQPARRPQPPHQQQRTPDSRQAVLAHIEARKARRAHASRSLLANLAEKSGGGGGGGGRGSGRAGGRGGDGKRPHEDR